MALVKVLIVANPYEASRLGRWLDRSPLPVERPVMAGDDIEPPAPATDDDPELPPAVIVVAANLATNDPRELVTNAAKLTPRPTILWLGEQPPERDDGPLHDSDDRVPWPAKLVRRPLDEAGFLASVRDALIARDVAVPAMVPPLAAPTSAPTSPGEHTDVAGFVGRQRTPPPRQSAVMEIAAAEMIDAFVSEQLALGARDTEAPTMLAEPPPVSPEREPTLILSGPQAVAPRPSLQIPAAAEPPTLALSRPLALPKVAMPAPGGLASELKRKMAAMERRLFGDDGSGMPDPDADTGLHDMDLDKIATSSSRSLLDELREPTLAIIDDDGFIGTDVFGGNQSEADAASASPASIDLATTDVATILGQLAVESFSGVATFVRGERVLTLHFEAGRPVFATSSSPHDRMGELLYREGKITRAHYEASKHIVVETGRRMGEILVELGYLKRRELLPAVRRHLEDLVYALFAWEQGTARLAVGAPPDEKIRLSAHPVALVFEGVRRKYSVGRLEACLGGTDVVLLPPNREALATTLAEAGATAAERAAAEAIDGRRTLAEVASMTPGGRFTAAQVAHALCALKLARPRPSEAERAATRSATGGERVGTNADVEIDRERVLGKHALVLDGDYFTVLGLKRDATGFEIRRAWEAARRDFAVESFPIEIQQGMGGELREILDVLDEAYRVLVGEDLRTRYLANLVE